MPRTAYRLDKPIFATMLKADGGAAEELTLEAGTVLYQVWSSTRGNESPWTGECTENRPHGRVMSDEIGTRYVLPTDATCTRTPEYDATGPREQALARPPVAYLVGCGPLIPVRHATLDAAHEGGREWSRKRSGQTYWIEPIHADAGGREYHGPRDDYRTRTTATA
jgi:hypothetical protein